MICKNVWINLGAKKQAEGIIQIVGSYFFFIVEYFLAYSHTHTHTVLSLPILLTMDTEAVFMSWLLEIMLSEHGGSDFSLEK